MRTDVPARIRKGRLVVPVVERLLSKYRFGDGCWEYTGGRFDNEYGAFCLGGQNVHAHRVMFELFVSPVPAGAFVLHRCDNPPCGRWDHLFLGDHQANMTDRNSKGRARGGRPRTTHCSRGHERTEANTWVSATGARGCRTCHREDQATYRRRTTS